jgi:chemotaxis signal transduction protein
MSQLRPRSFTSIEALRQSFDESFSTPALASEADLEQFLAIRSAGQPLALRVAELTRLEGRREIVGLPVENRDLLGIAGIQGRLVPIYCLASLLGLGRDAADWRWIAVCCLPDLLGLAFESLDACFSTPRTSILELGGERAPREPVQHAVRFAGAVRNVVQLHSLQAVLRKIALGAGGAIKES